MTHQGIDSQATSLSQNDEVSCKDAKRFTFGLFADVQYGDVDTKETKHYRTTPRYLSKAIDVFNQQSDLSFVVNLGDIIEGAQPDDDVALNAEMQTVLKAMQHRLSSYPLYHVIGNHCLKMKRSKLKQALHLEHDFYSFIIDNGTYKGIVLGKKGVAINAIGTAARKTIQNFFKKKVFLGLFVKVSKDWRSRKSQLKKFGYIICQS